MKKIIKYLFYGIAYGCMWFVLIGIIVTAYGNGQAFSGMEFIRQAVAAILVGIGFGTTSIVYEKENLSLVIQATIHMGLGFAVFFIVGLWAKWVPIELGTGAVLTFIIIELIIGFIIWGCFYGYYRHIAKKMNKKIKERQEAEVS